MTQTRLQVQQLSRRYGEQLAVNGISFKVEQGEVLGFLGPNGAGKSTTMQMITGNLAPSTGEVSVNGIDLLDNPKEAKAMIGFLPEQPPLYRELTVDEFLGYCAKLHGIRRRGVAEAVDQVKQRCGLTDMGRRLINNLSKGYQQRVGIAQAIIHSPELVILDEPTVGLDPIQIRSIRGLIKELGDDHSVILSTHILPEVQATCDRVQIINRGELVVSDTIEGMMGRMAHDSMRIKLRQPPPLTELEQISGVVAVEALAEGHFRLACDPEQDPAEQVAIAAVEAGWGLLELTPEQRSLEDIFVDITCSESEEMETV
ncbi:ATP-binding cassette domain-containing protein [Ectothiorhodospiraceae bacterium BW-2]|nr:ATP-binding cassette domain-containing protein [Ectothiorhodospiraceae bacterium BW-2]